MHYASEPVIGTRNVATASREVPTRIAATPSREPAYEPDFVDLTRRTARQRFALLTHVRPESESLYDLAMTSENERELSLIAAKASSHSPALHAVAMRTRSILNRFILIMKASPNSYALASLLRTSQYSHERLAIFSRLETDSQMLRDFSRAAVSEDDHLLVLTKVGSDCDLLSSYASHARSPRLRNAVFAKASPESRALLELFRSSSDPGERAKILQALDPGSTHLPEIIRAANPLERLALINKTPYVNDLYESFAKRAQTFEEAERILARCPARYVRHGERVIGRARDQHIPLTILRTFSFDTAQGIRVAQKLAEALDGRENRMALLHKIGSHREARVAFIRGSVEPEERDVLRERCIDDEHCMRELAQTAVDPGERIRLAHVVTPNQAAYRHLTATVCNPEERSILRTRGEAPPPPVLPTPVRVADSELLEAELHAARTLTAFWNSRRS